MVQLVTPSRGHVTQWFGNMQPDGLPHAGQDYAYTNGAETFPEVFAAADGVVQFAGDSRTLPWPNAWYVNNDFNRADRQDSSAGNLITIRHKQFGADTGYAHLERCFVKAGDTVKAGQQIGIAGNTGYSFGRHLHFFLMFHPFNYGTSTYGCSDPNPYFTSGLAAQGSIAAPTEQGFLMALSDKTQSDMADNSFKTLEALARVDDAVANILKSVAFQERFTVAMLEKIAAQSGAVIDTAAVAADIRAKLAQQIGK